ncbi:MAG TPA: hypothetical protein VFJ90_11655, partial [Candidatus Didemnitutus sp.]|nr:hypothetical protein [Candidatus Didemnitutus sp.]
SNAANQAKALHLTPFIAAVQRGPDVLQLLADDPFGAGSKYHRDELSCFLTHLTVPATAELWAGEQPIQPGSPEHPRAIAPETSLFIRLGDAVIAVRFLLTRAADGKPAAVEFVENAPGSVARRLTVTHAASAVPGIGCVVVALRAAEHLDAPAFVAFRRSFADTPQKAEISGNDLRASFGALGIDVDLARRERRALTGGEPDAVLAVNGRDFGKEILGRFAKP